MCGGGGGGEALSAAGARREGGGRAGAAASSATQAVAADSALRGNAWQCGVLLPACGMLSAAVQASFNATEPQPHLPSQVTRHHLDQCMLRHLHRHAGVPCHHLLLLLLAV
jgi:hypothetical protein